MSFSNFDSWCQDFEYDSNGALSNCKDSLRSPGCSESLPTLSTSTLSTAAPEIDSNGWQKIPEDLLKPENWGLPPPSPKLFSQALKKNVLAAALDYPPQEFAGPNSTDIDPNIHQQFYPDFDSDSDLINDKQLDGLPFLIGANSKVKKSTSSPFLTKGSTKTTKRGSVGSKRSRLMLSQRWEQSLLSAAYQDPKDAEQARRMSECIPPGRRGGFKSFSKIGGGDGGGGDDRGTRPDPKFGQGWNGGGSQGGAQLLGGQSEGGGYRGPGGGHGGPDGSSGGSGYTIGGPGQSLSAGPGGSDPGHPAPTHPTISEGARTLGSRFYLDGPATNFRKAAAEAAKRRDAATRTEQMRNAAVLKREGYEKEIRKMKRVQEAMERKEKEQREDKERTKKIQRKAREIKERKEVETEIKNKDARELAIEAAAMKDSAKKDQQFKRAESLKERYAREEREKNGRAVESKRRAEEKAEEAEQAKRDNLQGAKASRRAIDIEVEEKSADARELARRAAERRFAAMDKQRRASAKTPVKAASRPSRIASNSIKAPAWGSAKTPAKLTPKPSSKPTPSKTHTKPAPKPTEKKNFPVRTKPVAKPAPFFPTLEGNEDHEDYNPVDEPVDPREAVCRAMAAREAAICALQPDPVDEWVENYTPPTVEKPISQTKLPTKPKPKSTSAKKPAGVERSSAVTNMREEQAKTKELSRKRLPTTR